MASTFTPIRPNASQADTASSETTPAQATALMKAFFGALSEWGVDNDGAMTLLGRPSRSRFFQLKGLESRALAGLSTDELDRLAYLVTIYADLNVLFTPENQQRWMTQPAASDEAFARPWGNAAPLTYLLTGSMSALIDVFRYVKSLRHG